MVVYCDKCKCKLCERDPFIFELFDFIVEQYFHDTPLEISTDFGDYPDLLLTIKVWNACKFLEDQNYIVSTEASLNTFKVKPLGFDKSGQTVKICCFCEAETGLLYWD